MVSKGATRFVLWPHYFDAGLSREQGRRVADAVAVRQPDAQWIATAAKRLQMDAEVDEKVAHPSIPYEKVGRVLVEKKGSKEAVIRQVAAKMHEMQTANESR